MHVQQGDADIHPLREISVPHSILSDFEETAQQRSSNVKERPWRACPQGNILVKREASAILEFIGSQVMDLDDR